MWHNIKKEKPPKDAPYIIHAPSLDYQKPMIQIAWYNPSSGWSLIPEVWIDSITHWMPLPKPPRRK
jgi:hypothetical protein